MWNMLPKNLVKLFNHNTTAQYVLAYLLLFFTIDLYNTDVDKGVVASLFYAGLIFVWFLLTSKLKLNANLAILGILFFSFIIHKYNEKNKKRLELLRHDEDSHFLQEEALKHQISRLAHVQHFLFFIIVVITLLGNYCYLKKNHQKFYSKDKGILDFLKKYLFNQKKTFYPAK